MKIIHVTIETAMFQEEVEFFVQHVGLTLAQEIEANGKRIAFLSNAPDETNIEIIENNDIESIRCKNISIGFLTEDVQTKRQELDGEGYAVSPIISPMDGVKFFFVTDPAGVRIQFMQ